VRRPCACSALAAGWQPAFASVRAHEAAAVQPISAGGEWSAHFLLFSLFHVGFSQLVARYNTCSKVSQTASLPKNFVPEVILLCFLGYEDKVCNLFNGTWVRDSRGPIYTNFTCPTMPDSKNCGKYGKQMDYVNWKWVPHGCDMVRFEPQLFLNIVRGKTMAFAADSIGRNQMESLLCLLSQVSNLCFSSARC